MRPSSRQSRMKSCDYATYPRIMTFLQADEWKGCVSHAIDLLANANASVAQCHHRSQLVWLGVRSVNVDRSRRKPGVLHLGRRACLLPVVAGWIWRMRCLSTSSNPLGNCPHKETLSWRMALSWLSEAGRCKIRNVLLHAHAFPFVCSASV